MELLSLKKDAIRLFLSTGGEVLLSLKSYKETHYVSKKILLDFAKNQKYIKKPTQFFLLLKSKRVRGI